MLLAASGIFALYLLGLLTTVFRSCELHPTKFKTSVLDDAVPLGDVAFVRLLSYSQMFNEGKSISSLGTYSQSSDKPNAFAMRSSSGSG